MVLDCTVRYGTVQYSTVWYCTVWYGMVLYCMVQYRMIQHSLVEITTKVKNNKKIKNHNLTVTLKQVNLVFIVSRKEIFLLVSFRLFQNDIGQSFVDVWFYFVLGLDIICTGCV